MTAQTAPQIFVNTVAPSPTAFLWILIVLVVVTMVLVLLTESILSSEERSTRSSWTFGIATTASVAAVIVLVVLGFTGKAQFLDAPREYQQRAAVPVSELRELYNLERDILPDGMQVTWKRELINPGVHLIREEGTYRGSEGVFWSIDLGDTTPTERTDTTSVWVLEGPSVVRGK